SRAGSGPNRRGGRAREARRRGRPLCAPCPVAIPKLIFVRATYPPTQQTLHSGVEIRPPAFPRGATDACQFPAQGDLTHGGQACALHYLPASAPQACWLSRSPPALLLKHPTPTVSADRSCMRISPSISFTAARRAARCR